MNTLRIYVIVCILAAIAPFLVEQSNSRPDTMPFPGWPTHFEGQPLRELPLSDRESYFKSGFPGRIGRFTDGNRELVIRWVTEETRKLHPGVDCFKGVGYSVRPLPVRIDTGGNRWGCFEATGGGENLRVCERIYNETSHTGISDTNWTDVSSWYWTAFLGKTQGPWWAVTVAENLR
jgi:hypothetical protein